MNLDQTIRQKWNAIFFNESIYKRYGISEGAKVWEVEQGILMQSVRELI